MTTSNKSESPRVKQEPEQLPETTARSTQSADAAALVIRFASNEKPLGRTISFVIKSLRDGKQPVILQGSGLAMTKVVTVAGIARDRVGDVHQICEFLDIAGSREGSTGTTGIQITLSSKDVDAKMMESIGYCEPLQKGFMLADLSESARNKILNRRRQGQSRPKSARKTQADEAKSKKASQAEEAKASSKERDASSKSKKKQKRNRKSSADKQKAVDEKVAADKKNDAPPADNKQKKRKNSRRNKKVVDDENMPPSNVSAKQADPKTPTAADKKKGEAKAHDEHPSNTNEKVFTGGSAVRRGPPRYFYENYNVGPGGQRHYYEHHPQQYVDQNGYHQGHPRQGYYGSPGGYGASPSAGNGYQRSSPYVNNRGGANQRAMYAQSRYPQQPYQMYSGRRGGGYGGYGQGRGLVGDYSGGNNNKNLGSGQRSNASHRDEILDQSSIKREIGTRGNMYDQ